MSVILSSKQPTVAKNELINFINDKCTSLFVPWESETTTFEDDDDDDYGFKGKLL